MRNEVGSALGRAFRRLGRRLVAGGAPASRRLRVVLLDQPIRQIEVGPSPDDPAFVPIDDQGVALARAHAPENRLHAREDVLRELRFLLRELALVLDVLRLQLDELLLVLLRALLERVLLQDLRIALELLLLYLDPLLLLVQGGLPLVEELLQLVLRATAVFRLVESALQVDERDLDVR